MKTKKIWKNALIIGFDFLFVLLVDFLRCLGTFPQFFKLPNEQLVGLLIFSLVSGALLCLVFWIFGIYRLLLDNFGFFDALKIVLIVLLVDLLEYCAMWLITSEMLPRFSVFTFVLGAFMLAFLVCFSRCTSRLRESLSMQKKKAKVLQKRTLVIGAGAAAKIVIDDSRKNLDSKSHVIVLVDDDQSKIGRLYSGIPVVGPISAVSSFVSKYKIDEVVIAIENLSQSRLSEILNYLRDDDVQIRRLPLLAELERVNQKVVLNVDINEILGRPQVVLDNSEISSMLKGKTVLVTGAGGSIGSELVRQIYKNHPKKIILFDIYENCLYDIQQSLLRDMAREGRKDLELITLIGSTYNETRVEQIFKEHRPDFIYHAAAYKHVPLMEESPVEAVRTNVFGTYNVAKMADKYGATKMLLVSTDKAVRPTNAMGATKRFAEMIIQYFSSISKTKYCAVRFGNVLGSNGSVIPLFTKQIEEGGPVTVTDPEIIRYFMTIPEAVGLILQCSLYANGGEIFILDMGAPVKILDLAKKMIRQAGFVPGKQIKIVYSGLRPGEKLFEETLIDPTSQKKTNNSKIFIEEPEQAKPIVDYLSIMQTVFDLPETPNDVKRELSKIVDSYKPQMDD
jgi:FlaA1/EpsC-like NDP-sugar epimerase